MAESVDAPDLKSVGMQMLWGFKSPCPHRWSGTVVEQSLKLAAELTFL